MIKPVNRYIFRRKVVWIPLLAALLVGWGWLLTLYGESIRLALLDLLNWVEELGPWGPIFFILAVTASMFILLPGMIFTLGGGFLFGVFNGLLYVLIGTAIGASITFLIGRYLCRNWVNTLLARHTRSRRFVQIVEAEGMRFIALTRMVPFFPFKLSNYIFGASNMPYPQFIIGTCLGIVPISLTNVYAGSLASDLAALGTDTIMESPLAWTLYGGGFIILIIFALYISRLARKALHPYIGDQNIES